MVDLTCRFLWDESRKKVALGKIGQGIAQWIDEIVHVNNKLRLVPESNEFWEMSKMMLNTG